MRFLDKKNIRDIRAENENFRQKNIRDILAAHSVGDKKYVLMFFCLNNILFLLSKEKN